MQRGKLLTVSLPGDDVRPRPVLIVQTDLMAEPDSVVPRPVTSKLQTRVSRKTSTPSSTEHASDLAVIRSPALVSMAAGPAPHNH